MHDHSTSTATSGAFLASQQHQLQQRASGAPPRSSKRRGSRAPAAEVVETDAELPPPGSNNTAVDGETCSMANANLGDAVVSPLKAASGKKVLPSSRAKTVSSPAKPTRPSENAERRVPRQLMGPAFPKSLFVVLVLAALVSALWNWNTSSVQLPDLPTAIQLRELQDFSKKTTKWMQVQLEIVDMKIGKEVLGLRKEMEDRLEEQALSLETSIHSLRSQVEDMDISLHRLTEDGLLTKKEGVELIHSILQQRAQEESERALTLDDVRAAAKQMVETELEKHSADGIGRVDYALGSGGGKVIDHSEGFFYGSRGGWLSILGSGLSPGGSVKHPMAHKVIEPSFGEPGQCLPLKGSNAFVEIALRTHIYPEAITIEHVSKSVAYDVTSALKDFHVFGWFEKSIQANSMGQSASKFLLGEFSYSLDKSSVQTFHLPEESQRQLINTVRVHVLSNHGSPTHTCIYRVRVHGSEREPESTQPALGA